MCNVALWGDRRGMHEDVCHVLRVPTAQDQKFSTVGPQGAGAETGGGQGPGPPMILKFILQI